MKGDKTDKEEICPGGSPKGESFLCWFQPSTPVS